jgi:hypothetical protein
MFYPSVAIARVTAEIQESGDIVTLEITGAGFNPKNSPALINNGDNLRLDATADPPVRPAAGHFQVVNSGLIQATVLRKTYYPQWHLQLFQNDGRSQQFTEFIKADDGPPDASIECETIEAPVDKKTGNLTSLHFRVTGKYFSSAYPPVVVDKDTLAISSPVLVSSSAWDISGTPGKGVKNAALQFKGSGSPVIRTIVLRSDCKKFPKLP